LPERNCVVETCVEGVGYGVVGLNHLSENKGLWRSRLDKVEILVLKIGNARIFGELSTCELLKLRHLRGRISYTS
jgi:hypothetical protein